MSTKAEETIEMIPVSVTYSEVLYLWGVSYSQVLYLQITSSFFKIVGKPLWEKSMWKEKRKKEIIMPSLVATMSALARTTCVGTHHVRTKSIIILGNERVNVFRMVTLCGRNLICWKFLKNFLSTKKLCDAPPYFQQIGTSVSRCMWGALYKCTLCTMYTDQNTGTGKNTSC